MKSLTMSALYVFSIVLAVGIGMGQVGGNIAEQIAALPKCQHGPQVKPACIGDGCGDATYKTYLSGSDTIAKQKDNWPAGTSENEKNQCFVSSPANPPGSTIWNACDAAAQPYYTTDDACE